MPLSKPFPHIYRPGPGSVIEPFRELRADPRIRNMLASYRILKRDLRRALEFVEPHEKNLKTFSHRLFELLLRASTEVEAIFKLIFRANQARLGKRVDILRFSDLDGPMQLSSYEVVHSEFDLPPMKPFSTFACPIRTNRGPAWYKAYNFAKHDRGSQFERANLENALEAIAAVYVLIVAQIGPLFDTTLQVGDGAGFMVASDLFRIDKLPTWSATDEYSYDWSMLKTDRQPYDLHPIPQRP